MEGKNLLYFGITLKTGNKNTLFSFFLEGDNFDLVEKWRILKLTYFSLFSFLQIMPNRLCPADYAQQIMPNRLLTMISWKFCINSLQECLLFRQIKFFILLTSIFKKYTIAPKSVTFSSYKHINLKFQYYIIHLF